jgi:hypothetical protein
MVGDVGDVSCAVLLLQTKHIAKKCFRGPFSCIAMLVNAYAIVCKPSVSVRCSKCERLLVVGCETRSVHLERTANWLWT